MVCARTYSTHYDRRKGGGYLSLQHCTMICTSGAGWSFIWQTDPHILEKSTHYPLSGTEQQTPPALEWGEPADIRKANGSCGAPNFSRI